MPDYAHGKVTNSLLRKAIDANGQAVSTLYYRYPKRVWFNLVFDLMEQLNTPEPIGLLAAKAKGYK